ncbi:hypothetical protein [Streptosporangium canum]|uniref:hypothetical protein n=1 Tax=Streptosporangium canum TaxID=324952 RepID=UPI0015A5F975|nr:hypothetical protein [Streptosporangium canum]
MPATSPRPPRADARHDRDRPLDPLTEGLRRHAAATPEAPALRRRAAATPEAPAAPRARDAFPASREGDR